MGIKIKDVVKVYQIKKFNNLIFLLLYPKVEKTSYN